MPLPLRDNDDRCSKTYRPHEKGVLDVGGLITLTWWPFRAKQKAAAHPPKPAPMMIILNGRARDILRRGFDTVQ